MRTLSTLLILLTALLVGACGEEGGESAKVQKPYEILVLSPPLHGVQVDRPFSLTLDFVVPGTSDGRVVASSERLSVAVFSGPGSLVGSPYVEANGTSRLTLDDLRLSAVGTYVLQINGQSSLAPAFTDPFEVSGQLDLRFAAMPAAPLQHRDFSVIVEVIDPLTQQLAVPPHDVPVMLALNTGSGGLTGTLTRTISGSSQVVFDDLLYPMTGSISFRAVAYGYPDVVSGAIMVDGLELVFQPPAASAYVNGAFSLSLDIRSVLSGAPVSPSPGIDATVSVAGGSGTLSGGVDAVSSGSVLRFAGLRYDAIDTATFTVRSAETPDVTSPAISFRIELRVFATGPTAQPPSTSWAPFEFRALEGNGAPWAGAIGSVSWSVRSGAVTLQSGNSAFVGGIATVMPTQIATPGSYTLTGTINSPTPAQAGLALTVTTIVPVNQPGPFVALKTVRVNEPFTDSVAHATSTAVTGFGVLQGNLPAGLGLETTTGEISGTPTVAGSYYFALYATMSNGNALQIRCALAVFSANESEIVNGLEFSQPGPHSVTGPFTETFSFTSTFDGVTYPQAGTFQCRLRVFAPQAGGSATPAPAFIHHRGRGFNVDDYDNLGRHLASYGIVFISVEDYQSFRDGGGSGRNPIQHYDGVWPERGMQSASAFQEGAMQRALALSSQTGHFLEGRIDPEKIFMGGHSRGGGATHASHVRSQRYEFNGIEHEPIHLRGVIHLMAFDLRAFFSTITGNAQTYPIPTQQPRLPSLFISAERDADLVFPICDQFIDRATGPTTFATIYGGAHNYATDYRPAEAQSNPHISRQRQQELTHSLVVAFIKRWADLNLALDGMLYHTEFAGSKEIALTAWRNMANMVMVDDHQGPEDASNSLGGVNSISSGSFSTEPVYPTFSAFGTLGIKHNLLTLEGETRITYTSRIPAGVADLRYARRIKLRIGQIDSGSLPGYNWVKVSLRVVDAAGAGATVVLYDPANPNNTYLPLHPGTGEVAYDRFVQVSVRIAQLQANNPTLIIPELRRVELVFDTASGPSRQVYFDDLRFE